jgi:hypothetical protein
MGAQNRNAQIYQNWFIACTGTQFPTEDDGRKPEKQKGF